MRKTIVTRALGLGLGMALAASGCMGSGSSESSGKLGPDGLSPQGSNESALCTGVTIPVQTLRRLNRVELARSLESLLGSSTGVFDSLPSDDSVLFDNDADALSVSPTMVEKYDELFTALVGKALLPSASGGTGARERILVCAPAANAEATCAKTIVAGFATKAWRKAASEVDVDTPMSIFTQARTSGETFESSIGYALRSVLLSPSFLFRIEKDGGPGVAHIDDLALATRLSFFLWSSPPDDELLRVASEGRLSNPAELEAQTRRMLHDGKASALVDNFGVQWLGLRAFEPLYPSPDAYPTFNEFLRTSMREETKRTFASFMTAQRSFLDILDSSTTFLDERLAKHYGIAGVTGTQFREVPLPAERVGLLTQASLLMGGSTPTRASPSKRGHFILDRMLCRPPPPPPPNVSADVEVDTTLPMRERLKAHRENPTCAGCHAEMDPIGLSFENFDSVGAYRATYMGQPIDTSGSLPDGTTFANPRELAQTLKQNPQFTDCLGEQLFSYAMGRAAKFEDRCSVRAVVQRFEQTGHRFEELVVAIVQSEAFRSRQAQPK